MALVPEAVRPRYVDFGGLRIAWDDRVLEPRPWTIEQPRWLAELSPDAPPGPALELCSGAGHLGLVLAHHTGRHLVQVELDPVAAGHNRANAQEAGLSVEVRTAPMARALDADERFALLLADPPWVPSGRVHEFPEDPVVAIDGGAAGLDLARDCLRLADRHLLREGHAVLQVGTGDQVHRLWDELGPTLSRLELMEVRQRPRGTLAHFTAVA